MILFLDDNRTIQQVTSLTYRNSVFLPAFTDEQKDILRRDIRKNVYHAKTVEQAQEFIINNPLPDMIFFDNDLGDGLLEGKYFLNWLLQKGPSKKFEAYFHTANRPAREYMISLYNTWVKMFWE
jgi:CheY-like chemotaxis protein